MDYSSTEIKFLGVNITPSNIIAVTKAGNKLKTDLYCISTDTHQYLHE